MSDDGLIYLRELKRLQSLNLEGTQLRGTGLVHLKELSGLQYWKLTVPSSLCAIADLQRALPKCRIE